MLLIWYRLGLIVYLLWILGYECHDRLDTNVEKDECHDRLDTNVEKDGYECY